jgi:hypothetical protein
MASAKVKGLDGGAVVDASGCSVAAVLPSGAVRVALVYSAGGTPVVMDYPAPGRGRIVALSADGPTVLLDSGEWFYIAPGDVTWRSGGNVLAVEADA